MTLILCVSRENGFLIWTSYHNHPHQISSYGLWVIALLLLNGQILRLALKEEERLSSQGLEISLDLVKLVHMYSNTLIQMGPMY